MLYQVCACEAHYSTVYVFCSKLSCWIQYNLQLKNIFKYGNTKHNIMEKLNTIVTKKNGNVNFIKLSLKLCLNILQTENWGNFNSATLNCRYICNWLILQLQVICLALVWVSIPFVALMAWSVISILCAF